MSINDNVYDYNVGGTPGIIGTINPNYGGSTTTFKKTTVEEFDENERMVKRTITEETVTTYPYQTYITNAFDNALKS